MGSGRGTGDRRIIGISRNSTLTNLNGLRKNAVIDDDRARSDHNLGKKIEAVRKLEQLILALTSHDNAHASIELVSRHRRLGRLKVTITEFSGE